MDRRKFIEYAGIFGVGLFSGCSQLNIRDNPLEASLKGSGDLVLVPNAPLFPNENLEKFLSPPSEKIDAKKYTPNLIVMNNVVELFNPNNGISYIDESQKLAFSTGFFIDKDGFFITVAHGLSNYQKQGVSMRVYNPHMGLSGGGKIIAYSDKVDIALGKFFGVFEIGKELNQVFLSKNNNPNILSNLSFAKINPEIDSSPFDHSDTFIDKEDGVSTHFELKTEFLKGRCGGKAFFGSIYHRDKLLYSNIPGSPGDSGSPFFDSKGKLLGIEIYLSRFGVRSYFAPSSSLRSFIKNYSLLTNSNQKP